jgi:hypothetical protein
VILETLEWDGGVDGQSCLESGKKDEAESLGDQGGKLSEKPLSEREVTITDSPPPHSTFVTYSIEALNIKTRIPT